MDAKLLSGILLISVILISGCTTAINDNQQGDTELSQNQIDEVYDDLGDLIIDETNGVELGSLI